MSSPVSGMTPSQARPSPILVILILINLWLLRKFIAAGEAPGVQSEGAVIPMTCRTQERLLQSLPLRTGLRETEIQQMAPT